MIKQSLFGLLLLMVATKAVFANTNLYQVELLVFQYTDKQALQSEYWSDKEHWSMENNAVIVESNTPKTLTTELWALKQKLNFPIITHISWQQPITRSNRPRLAQLPANSSLSGTLSFKQSNYLELDADLQLENYQIKESRRIRLGEVHYLDHPAFGALIKITRI